MGEPGTNGQHAFFQLLHRGTDLIPVDFIARSRPRTPCRAIIACCSPTASPRAKALMVGKTADEVRAELTATRA